MRCTVFPSSESITSLTNGHIELETVRCIRLVFSAISRFASLPFFSSFPGWNCSFAEFASLLYCSKSFFSVDATRDFGVEERSLCVFFFSGVLNADPLRLLLFPGDGLDFLDFLALGSAPDDPLFVFLVSAMVEIWVGGGERRGAVVLRR